MYEFVDLLSLILVYRYIASELGSRNMKGLEGLRGVKMGCYDQRVRFE